MIVRLPTLLEFEYLPSVLGRKASEERQSTKQRRKLHRNQIMEKVLPLSPPAPLQLRVVQKTKPPRYQGNNHLAAAPFWERQKQEEDQLRAPRKQAVASIRRQSQLFTFLLTLCSLAAVDPYMFLPTGTILYALAIAICFENWELEAQENRRYMEKIRKHREQLDWVEKQVLEAQFEYHVLRNQPHVDIRVLRKTKNRDPEEDFDPDNDEWIVYADTNKHRRPPRPPPLRFPPPRQQRSNGKKNKSN